MITTQDFQNCDEILNFTSAASEADEALEQFRWSGADKLLITIILPVCVFVGILANLAFLITVARVERMRTVTNYYLVNLAISDLVFLLISFGDQIYAYQYSVFQANLPAVSNASCWLSIFPVIFSYYASLQLVTLVSLERYYAICKPVQKHQMMNGKREAVKMILVTWIVAAALGALSSPRNGKLRTACIIWPDEEEYEQLPTTHNECVEVNFVLGLIAEVLRIVLFVIAMLINVVAYYKLLRNLSKRKTSESSRRSRRKRDIRNQVARIVTINVAAFFVLQLPSRVLNVDRFIRIHTGTLPENYGTIYSLGFGFLLLNSVINPFIYGFGSRLYRAAFSEAFRIDSCKSCQKVSDFSSADMSISKDYSQQSQNVGNTNQDSNKTMTMTSNI